MQVLRQLPVFLPLGMLFREKEPLCLVEGVIGSFVHVCICVYVWMYVHMHVIPVRVTVTSKGV